MPQSSIHGGSADFVEPYLPVEDVAQRLGLPLVILLRRVEAGDVPARRDEGPDGVTWSVRLSDLGVEPDRLAGNGWEGQDEPGVEAVAGAVAPADVSPPEDELEVREEDLETDEQEPEPAPAQALSVPLEPAGGELRQEVQSMMLDGRELVAGLLDRWERTLEQRIFAEQRQRFELELNARQNLVKQLQLELQTARAENAATQADRDRRLAEKERSIADIERQLGAAQESAARRRGWFWRK
jgi:hypothetical protein